MRADVAALVKVAGSPLRNKVTGVLPVALTPDETRFYLKRATCCQAYRQEDHGYCNTCPHLPLAERVERLRTVVLAERAETEAA